MSKLLVFLVICIAFASCVELENLCSSDHFEYNGVLVNAFHRNQQNLTFPGLKRYLINHTIICDRSDFKNTTNYYEILRIRGDFNLKFTEIYTNDLNGATAEELQEKRSKLSEDWSQLYDMAKVEQLYCVKTFEKIAYSAYNVLNNLEWVTRLNSYPVFDEAGFKPSDLEAIKTQEKLFEYLKNAGDGQTFALKDMKAFDVHFKWGLVLPGEFKFLTKGSVQPETESLFTYQQILPFNSDKHTDEGCVPLKELPSFYKNKELK